MSKPLVLGMLATLVAAPALAHAFLSSSAPAVGSTVHAIPSAVSIRFTEGVEPAFSTIAVQDAAGQRVDTGSVHLGAGGDTSLIAPLKPLKPGDYTVLWHATSTDTHKTSGRFSFTVAP